MESAMESSGGSGRPGRGLAAGSRSTWFRPGDDHPKRKAAAAAPAGGLDAETGAGAGELDDLAVMRRVWGQPKSMDRTPSEKRMRQWLERDVRGFRREMRDLARAERGRVAAEAGPGAMGECPPDPNSERLQDLVHGLLDEFHEEEARKNAELAARPDAAEIAASLQNALTAALDRQRVLTEQVADLRAKVRKLGGDPDVHIDAPAFYAGRRPPGRA